MMFCHWTILDSVIVYIASINKLDAKDTTDTQKYAFYLDLHLAIDNWGRSSTKLYDKRDDFTFPIVNVSFISSNIPASPAYGDYISQLIRHSRTCVQYNDVMERSQLLMIKPLKQGYVAPRWSHRYKHYTVVITIWLTIMKYP